MANKVHNQNVRVRIVKGSLQRPEELDRFHPKLIEAWNNSDWQGLFEVVVPYEELPNIQRNTTKHYDSFAPWYFDGEFVDDPSLLVCCFGADDKAGGKIFTFRKGDIVAYDEIKKYGIENGIPLEQIDFLEANKNRM